MSRGSRETLFAREFLALRDHQDNGADADDACPSYFFLSAHDERPVPKHGAQRTGERGGPENLGRVLLQHELPAIVEAFWAD